MTHSHTRSVFSTSRHVLLFLAGQTGRLRAGEGRSEQVTFQGDGWVGDGWVDAWIVERSRIMSGVLIHPGQTGRREERRGGCQRGILCQNCDG